MNNITDDCDEFSVSTTELAECAKINFENVEKMNPSIRNHPLYALAKRQLDASVARMIADDEASQK